MGSYLNLLGSIIIGSLLLLSINRFSSSLTQNTYEKTLDSITSHNVSTISKLIEYDFNRMGLKVPYNTTALIQADLDSICFLSDINDDGVVDTVQYVISDSTSDSTFVNYSENPGQKLLCRRINSDLQQEYTLDVTEFELKYFDALGNETTNLQQIKTFEISVMVEGTSAYDNKYSQFFWQTRISPPNLSRY